ncbi:uncharacterized protein UHOD_12092 [Ustilago sp. UG-2017b]|nr:uncharacterized protein UHOD_12092 [Ustilago sp. UG-2017b]
MSNAPSHPLWGFGQVVPTAATCVGKFGDHTSLTEEHLVRRAKEVSNHFDDNPAFLELRKNLAEVEQDLNKIYVVECCLLWFLSRSVIEGLYDFSCPTHWCYTGLVESFSNYRAVRQLASCAMTAGWRSIMNVVGDVGGNSVASTRVSSVLTDAWSDPRTAVDYCLRFYLNPDRWSAMNRLRTSLYESTLFVEYCTGGPSSTTPVLLELCVSSFGTAPPPYYTACLAPLCLLSCDDPSDTAPPPQDLLAGLLYTALPPSTGDGSFDSCLSSP